MSPRSRATQVHARLWLPCRPCRPGASPTLIEAASSAGLLVRYLPSFLSAVERDMRLSDLRGLRVEHLLGRRRSAYRVGSSVQPDSRPARAGNWCRRVDRLGAVPADHPLPARGAVPARLRRVEPAHPAVGSDRLRPAGLRRHHHRQHPRPAPHRSGLRRRPVPSWCSTRRRTSTCRCSNGIRARASRRTSWARRTLWTRRSVTAPSGSC